MERKYRHILKVARALRIQSSVPNRFWGECVRTVVYLINKLPTAVLKEKSPYEMFHGRAPKLDHLRVFCYLCYASILPREDKLAARANKTTLIGYSETQKGYRLYDLESKMFLVSRDVSFREDIFPFKGRKYEDNRDADHFLMEPMPNESMKFINSEA